MTAHEPSGPVSLDALLEQRAWVRRLARSLVADAASADDLEQDVWLAALERPPRHATSLRGWFARALRNAAVSRARRSHARAVHEAGASVRPSQVSPAHSVAAAELQVRIARAVLDLDEPYRTTVVLRWFDGLTATEIAMRQGLPVETVRTRLKRALATLRSRLAGPEGVDARAFALLLFGTRDTPSPAAGTRAASRGTGAGARATLAAGGLIMSSAAKVGTVCALLVVAVWWSCPRSSVQESATSARTVVGFEGASPREGRIARRHHLEAAPRDDSSAPPAATAAGPVQPIVTGFRVVDAEGAPLAGATVTVQAGTAGAGGLSDARGVAVLTGPGTTAAHVQGWFVVARDGYARRLVEVSPAGAVVDLPVVTLEPALPIEGRVVDQYGAPVAGASLELRREAVVLPQSIVESDAEGRFSFPDATEGRWWLRCSPPAPFHRWTVGVSDRAVAAGRRDLEVVMRRSPLGAARMKAVVVDPVTRERVPVVAAMFVPDAQSGERIRNPESSEDFATGTFTIDELQPGSGLLWVRVKDRGAFVVPVEIHDGGTEIRTTIEAGRPGRLAGRVDLSATDLGRILWVGISRPETDRTPEWGSYRGIDTTGGELVAVDGTFAYPTLSPGRYRLRGESEGWVGETEVLVPDGGEVEAVVTLVRGGRIRFRVTEPSPAGDVSLQLASGDGAFRTVAFVRAEPGKPAESTVTELPGRYRWRAAIKVSEATSAPAALDAGILEGEVVVVAGETSEVTIASE